MKSLVRELIQKGKSALLFFAGRNKTASIELTDRSSFNIKHDNTTIFESDSDTGTITMPSLDLDQGSLTSVKWIDFDLEDGIAHSEGRLHWCDDDKTLEMGLEGGTGVKLQIGQEIHVRCTNKSGGTISNGEVVYIDGSQGQRPTIAKADNSSITTAMTTIGVVTHEIADNATGYVTIMGMVRSLDTSSFSDGDLLWLSGTAGELTATRPDAPNTSVVIGVVAYSHATEGIIVVKPVVVHRLSYLSDVDVRAVTPTDEDVLYWDNGNSKWTSGSVHTLGDSGYGEMGSTADADEVIATADQWFAMFHTNINADLPHLNSQFTFTAGSEGVIASSSTDVGSTVTFTDTAHGLLVGDYITINGTTSYNTVYEVQSKTDNTFTVNATNSTGSESGLWQMGSYLTVSHTGVYRGVWNTSFKQSDNAARTSQIAPFVNTTQSTKAAASRYLSNTTDVGSVGGNGLMNFSVGDRVWFACKSTDPQTLTFTIRNVTIH